MEQDQASSVLAAETDDAPAPPPPMPDAAAPATVAAPAEPSYGWAVDPDRMRDFGDAVIRARSFLDAVRMKVERMQGTELTPQLGTSPVGQQLAKKFDDRLNSTVGLRAMLEEAMRRMQTFVASAEAAARSYEEMDDNARATFDGIIPDVGGLLKDVVTDLTTSGPGSVEDDNPYDDHGTYGDHHDHHDHDDGGHKDDEGDGHDDGDHDSGGHEGDGGHEDDGDRHDGDRHDESHNSGDHDDSDHDDSDHDDSDHDDSDHDDSDHDDSDHDDSDHDDSGHDGGDRDTDGDRDNEPESTPDSQHDWQAGQPVPTGEGKSP